MSSEQAYGARFLAELRHLGVTAGNFDYKTVSAIEAASRERLVELLIQGPPKASAEVVQLARTAEPEALARKLVESQQADGVISAILFSL
jgi:hypothetical protein